MKQPEETVLGQVERIEISRDPTGLPRQDFVVGVILVPDVTRADRLPERLLSFRVHSPTRNQLGSQPLEVGSWYEFRLRLDGKRMELVGYQPTESFASPMETTIDVGGKFEKITLRELFLIRDALVAYAEGQPSGRERDFVLTHVKHTTVSITENGSGQISLFFLIGGQDGLRLEYTPRPTGDAPHATFGISARLERRNDGWAVSSLDHTHIRWR